MEVRRFLSSDAAAVWQLHNLAMSQVGANMGPGPWNEDLNNISLHYLAGRGDFFVGFTSDTMVAIGGLREIDSDTAEIKRMRVLPECQRRGYGQQIFDQLQRSAISYGFRKLVLDTLAKQQGAIEFYTKNGFTEYGRGNFQGETQLLFQKLLQ